jgi:hypothetical protein
MGAGEAVVKDGLRLERTMVTKNEFSMKNP